MIGPIFDGKPILTRADVALLRLQARLHNVPDEKAYELIGPHERALNCFENDAAVKP